jgi:uncharacterized protein
VTPQEEQLIRNLADRVNSTRLEEKDPEAEALLRSSFASNPDVVYILAQTVLVQNFALDQAKAQVADLLRQAQEAQRAHEPAHATGFLGGLFGHRDLEPTAVPPAQPAYQPAAATSRIPAEYMDQPFQPVRQVAPPAGYPAAAAPVYPVATQPQYVPVGGVQPSFLRGALQTAAGVAAGALAFEGVESVLHGFSHPGYGWGGPGMGSFGMGPGMGAGFERPVDETVINNYYDQPAGSQEFGRHEAGEERRLSDEPARNEFHDASNQGQAQFNDATYNSQGNDGPAEDTSRYNPPDPYLQQDPQAGFDQGSYDQGNNEIAQNESDPANFDSGQDDGGNFGDSGGFDSSGGFDGGGDFS